MRLVFKCEMKWLINNWNERRDVNTNKQNNLDLLMEIKQHRNQCTSVNKLSVKLVDPDFEYYKNVLLNRNEFRYTSKTSETILHNNAT